LKLLEVTFFLNKLETLLLDHQVDMVQQLVLTMIQQKLLYNMAQQMVPTMAQLAVTTMDNK